MVLGGCSHGRAFSYPREGPGGSMGQDRDAPDVRDALRVAPERVTRRRPSDTTRAVTTPDDVDHDRRRTARP